jgi:hypothetical protein
MTKQLTQAQIKQLRVFLADYGLNVTARKASKQDERQPLAYRAPRPWQA